MREITATTRHSTVAQWRGTITPLKALIALNQIGRSGAASTLTKSSASALPDGNYTYAYP